MSSYDVDSAVWAGLERLPASNLIALIDDYIEATRALLSRMRRYATAGDPVRMAHLVHRFKGGSAAFGVRDVVQVCDAFENGAWSRTCEELAAWVEKLERAFGRAVYVLDEQRARLAQ